MHHYLINKDVKPLRVDLICPRIQIMNGRSQDLNVSLNELFML